jgi:hypothetical protein
LVATTPAAIVASPEGVRCRGRNGSAVWLRAAASDTTRRESLVGLLARNVASAARPCMCGPLGACRSTTIAAMHLRMPSIDRGVQSFIWAVVFFLFLYFGMVAIAVSKATALVLALVVGFLVFLLVRTRGDDDPRDAP